MKAQRLWPNNALLDNFVNMYPNWNEQFTNSGFLRILNP
jgi:hypothetical protein